MDYSLLVGLHFREVSPNGDLITSGMRTPPGETENDDEPHQILILYPFLMQVMESRPRSDIYITLPALRKLDAMLMEVLDSFQDAEFWYAEQGSMSSNSTRSGSFRRVITQRKEEK
ncbi:hypothetical protein OIU85_023194, partial [Salix viminalis]